MFSKGVTPEFIPERIYHLCKIVQDKPILDKELVNMMEPSSLNPGTKYYPLVRSSAIELGLIEKNDDDYISYISKKEYIENLDSFRKYCNSVVWKDNDSLFNKITIAFLNSNDSWLQYGSITSINVINEIRDFTKDSNADNKHILGHRFWMSFLGMGYIQERDKDIYFLPNMYVALKDFIILSNFEIGKEYSVREFAERISLVSKVAFGDNVDNSKKINLALSNALRTMYDKKEIDLKRNLDSKEEWDLYESDIHAFGNKLTHIIFKGVK